MLAIRMQRTGRKGHAQFRVIVQEARLTPTSGRVVASLGNYDPHTKVVALDKEKASLYLSNGAQPSDRVIRLLQAEGVKLPSWVKASEPKSGKLRNPVKLRKNQPAVPAEPVAETTEEAPVEKPAATEPVAAEEVPTEETVSPPGAETATEEPVAEAKPETETPTEPEVPVEPTA